MDIRFATLAIDPGETSGAAIWVRERLMDSGQVKGAQERARWVSRALRYAASESLLLLIVREKWTAGGERMHPAMALGLGAAWGAWREHLLMAGVSRNHVIAITPQQWRAALIGGKQRDREAWQAVAIAAARMRLRFEADDPDPGPDEAVALLLGHFVHRTPALVAKIHRMRKGKQTDA